MTLMLAGATLSAMSSRCTPSSKFARFARNECCSTALKDSIEWANVKAKRTAFLYSEPGESGGTGGGTDGGGPTGSSMGGAGGGEGATTMTGGEGGGGEGGGGEGGGGDGSPSRRR